MDTVFKIGGAVGHFGVRVAGSFPAFHGFDILSLDVAGFRRDNKVTPLQIGRFLEFAKHFTYQQLAVAVAVVGLSVDKVHARNKGIP